jgi:hypothetical protein
VGKDGVFCSLPGKYHEQKEAMDNIINLRETAENTEEGVASSLLLLSAVSLLVRLTRVLLFRENRTEIDHVTRK